MFEALKGKIQNVSTSLKGLQPPKRRSASDRSDCVDVHCGAELLNHYQLCWEDLHRNGESAIAEAQVVSVQLNNLKQTANRRSDAMVSLTKELRSMSSVADSLDTLMMEFTTIERLCHTVETGLDQLLQLQVTAQIRSRKAIKSQELIAIRNSRIQSFIRIQDQMELDYKEKLRAKQLRLQLQKAEKVKVLQEAFEDDLAYYKRTGKVKKMEANPPNDNKQTVVTMSSRNNSYPEVLGDANDFEQFLSDVPLEQSSGSATVGRTVLPDSEGSSD